MARPKGTANILSSDCKHSIMSVYAGLGGAEEMLKWAKNNQTEYYRILAGILPKEQKIEFINPLMTMTASDVARLILDIGRNRGFAVPSSIERIAGPETGALSSLSEAD